VIWLRIGNAGTSAIAALLRERYLAVRRFAEAAEATFLPLGAF
jgi:predicted nuclease of predicted toxin-antitoxin system